MKTATPFPAGEPANDDRPDGAVEGSGNVFRDLGLAEPDLLLAKADLVVAIRNRLGRSGPVEVAASARRLGLAPDALLALLRGRTGGHSVADLERLLDEASRRG